MYLLVHIFELFCALIIFEDCPRLERSSFMGTVLPMSGINFSATMTVVCLALIGSSRCGSGWNIGYFVDLFVVYLQERGQVITLKEMVMCF